jgi:flavin-dependent dehydrogenase
VTEKKSEQQYEVVIIGGGPAGSATAIQLLKSGIRSVLIVEKGTYNESRIGESLPPNANVLLRQLGVWDNFQKEGHLPVSGSCSIWGSEEPGYNDYFVSPNGFGWHLDRNRFDRFMVNQALALGAELRLNTSFKKSLPNDSGYGFYLELENPDGHVEQIQARFVVDASGMKAVFARNVPVERQIVDRLIFVSGFFELPGSISLTSLTLLEAVEYGWWYMATLPNNRVIAALATDPEVVSAYKLGEPANWFALLMNLRILPEHIKPHLHLNEKLMVSPALSSYLQQPCGSNWLAVGDAASSYDPIMSLGIYKSMLTGMEAGKMIGLKHSGADYDPDSYKTFLRNDFRKYEESRNYFYALEN